MLVRAHCGRAALLAGIAEERLDGSPECLQVSGSAMRRPCSPSSIWSTMPPTALATIGRSFHIASATVSPKPSARLFWTTTLAWRWITFTIAAASSGSAIGVQARWTRLLVAGQLPPDARALVQYLRGFWVVGHACHRGAAEEQDARRAMGRRGDRSRP